MRLELTTIDPMQLPCLIKHLGLTTPAAEVEVDGQGLP
jgi:hypothetical protein